MSNVQQGLKYSKDHEWVRVEGETATIGISDYAQHALGDVVYVDLPRVGETLEAHQTFGSVESVKAVSEVYSPIAGEVLEVNDTLNDAPETVNSDPYEGAWMIKLKMSNASEVNDLMDAEAYRQYLSANE